MQDCLILVSSSFSTRTSYENQTKKAITNKFVAQAMTEFLKHQLEVYFVEHPDEAEKACKQVLINKQSREHAEKARVSIKKTMTQQMDLANRVQKFVDCRTKDATAANCTSWRAIPLWARSNRAAIRSSRLSCPFAARS